MAVKDWIAVLILSLGFTGWVFVDARAERKENFEQQQQQISGILESINKMTDRDLIQARTTCWTAPNLTNEQRIKCVESFKPREEPK